MKILFFICLSLLSSSLTAQPRIDPLVTGKEVQGNHLLRLKPNIGEVFHYKLTTRTQASIKNANDLFTEGEWLNLKQNDKAALSTVFFITANVRSKRINSVTDFLIRIDSIHYTLDDNGTLNSFTSTRIQDRKNPHFAEYGALTGYDFGAIYDSTGSEKDIYAFYNTSDELFAALPDSLQTDDQMSTLRSQSSNALQTDFRNIFAYLPENSIAKDSSVSSTSSEDYTVSSTLDFPMEKEFKQSVQRFEEQGNTIYAVITDQSVLTPRERIIEEKDYKTTLPTFTYLKKNLRYIDARTGMIAYSKQDEDKSFSLQIEPTDADKDGKNFVTVQRTKSETIVELLK